MDAAVALQRSHQAAMPKLRKNKRIENKWGLKYHTAVREAVFGMQSVPYMPSEPPPSLSEDVSECEPLYVCKQCKDCFRFLSSYEDHNARRSWILGYWCQHCFLTICTHVPNGAPPCPICQKLERDKRSYLRTRGLKKSHKLGATRVFYNQCQFFAHLKTHNLTTVDMGDIMLMPLPTETINEWHPELDKACEALMEHSFLLRIHIADWLRAEKVDKNWWKLVTDGETKDNPMVKILENYQGRHFFPIKTPVSRGDTVDSNLSNFMLSSTTKYRDSEISDVPYKAFVKDASPSIIRSVETSSADNNVSENEDNPCTPADIDFVDCGLLPQHYMLENPLSSGKQKSKTTCPEVDHSALQDYQPVSTAQMGNKCKKSKANFYENLSELPLHCGNTTVMAKIGVKSAKKASIGPRSWKNGKLNQRNKSRMSSDMTLESNVSLNLKNSFNEISPEKMYTAHSNHSPAKKPKLATKSAKARQALQVTGMSSGSKILTFQSSKNVDLSTIINQLSPHLLVNKRIVLIGQDSEEVTVPSKQESHSPKRNNSTSNLVHDRNGKHLSKSVIPAYSHAEPGKNAGKRSAKVQSNIDNSTNEIPFSAKVVYQNGRKYIITQTHNANRTANSPDLPKDMQLRTLKSEYSGVPKIVNDTASESITAIQQDNLPQSDVSVLTPSPSPSELSTSSSEAHNKQTKSECQLSKTTSWECQNSTATSNKAASELLSFHEDTSGKLYLNVQVTYEKLGLVGSDENETISQWKNDMIKNFECLSCSELKERINHIEQVKIELEVVVVYLEENTVVANLESIKQLEQELKDAIEHWNDFDGASESLSTDIDVFSNDWEEQNDNKLNCVTCNKVVKPKAYIAGFSKLENDNVYCSCYKCVCHECCTYEGGLTRFIAHQNFHKKRKPYACPDCCQKFLSFKSLEVHTWKECFHMMKKRLFGCKICDINGFHDMESIARHYAIMHCQKRCLVCDVCHLVVPSYTEYAKHCKDEHSSATCNLIKVVVCQSDNCVVRCENYISHLERHHSIAKLTCVKCPFCSFVAVEDKRTSLTCQSHLYSEHLHQLSSIIDPQVLLEILPSKLAKEIFLTNSPALPDSVNASFVNAAGEQAEDDSSILKIVNTRTIPSEVFESGTQGIDEDLRRDSGSSLLTESTFQEDDECNARSVNLDDTVLSNVFEISSEVSLPKDLGVRSVTDIGPKSCNSVLKDMKAIRIARNSSGIMNVNLIEKDVQSDDANVMDKDPLLLASKYEKMDSRLRVIDIDEINNLHVKDSNILPNCSTNNSEITHLALSKPPPLARIPQYILDVPTANEERVEKVQKKNVIHRPSNNRKAMNRKRPCRIALNGPTTLKEAPLDYVCHICGDMINTSWPVIRNHFTEKHAPDYKLCIVTPRLLRISPDFINGRYKETYGNKKRKSESALSASKRRRRWTPKKYVDATSTNAPGLGLWVKPESAEDADGNFKCKKCNQSCADMSDLREHIASNHRIKGRYLVCLECGENFVVAPSLQMHLKAFHRIEDPVTYLSRNTSYAPDSIDDFEGEGKTTVANQCHVCMAVFEDKAAVDKHLRVHGMAFLNRKRIEARNAQSSPEKKTKTEEDSPVKDETKSRQRHTSDNSKNARKDNPAETILEKINASI